MTNAHGVARDQLRAFIERIERLEEEKKTIADDIKDVYGEAKGMGFDTVIMKRVIALRKKDEQQRMEEEAVLDTYLHALGMIAQHDLFEEPHHPETGEIIDPKLAQTIVTGMQTETGRKALIAAVDIMIAREEAEEHPHHLKTTRGDESGTLEGSVEDHGQVAGCKPESQTDGTGNRDGVERHATEIHANPEEEGAHGETVSVPSVDVGSRPVVGRSTTATSEIMDVTGGESAATIQPETATKQRVNGHSQHEGANAQAIVPNEVVTVVGTESGTVDNFETCERCQGNGEIVTDWDRYKHPHGGDIGDEAVAECPDCGGEGIIDVSPDTEIASAAHGEAEAPSVDSETEPSILGGEDSPGANAGGRHVNAQPHRAASAGALVQVAPATKPLRPHCRNPGEHCGGYGSNHCHSCLRAAREPELEACT